MRSRRQAFIVRIRTVVRAGSSVSVHQELRLRMLGFGALVALCATMIKMSIRRKLFFAFTLVAAISSAALLWLARSYIGTVRARPRSPLHRASPRCAQRQTQITAQTEKQAAFDILVGCCAEPDFCSLHSERCVVRRVLGCRAATGPGRAVGLEQAAHRSLEGAPRSRRRDPREHRPGRIAACLKDPHAARLGNIPVLWLPHDGPLFPFVPIGDETQLGFAIGQIDNERLGGVTTFGHEGLAVLVDLKSGKPWMDEKSIARVQTSLPGFERLLAHRPANGETADVDDGRGRRYHVYSAVSAETPLRLLDESLQALVVIPTDELYAPLAQIRARVLGSVIATLLLALVAAFFLSGRFVADIERIRDAVAAFAAGRLAAARNIVARRARRRARRQHQRHDHEGRRAHAARRG